jgi:DNA-binding CsgD family transcriptional regulator/tetratricopeptide (TPR) repeat protein
VVQQALADIADRATVLVCGCEALFTPRPLGPLVDLADQFPPSLASALHAGHTYNGLFPAFLAYLKRATKPVVMVIEDLHWADESTLDFIRYIGRRLTDVPALLVLTYRDDEITATHPLKKVLGELPTAATTRIPLQLLSAQSVNRLAEGSRHNGKKLYDITAGNPFFVAEVLASNAPAASDVPPSVLDAVIARVSRVSPSGRELIDLCSVVPGQIELAIVDRAFVDSDARIHECLASGALMSHPPFLKFRHELARLAVEKSLRPDLRLKLHRRVFDILHLPGCLGFSSLSRLLHHAQGGALVAEVMALSPQAAREAVAASSHREAAVLYGLALTHQSQSQPELRAALLEEAALEYRLTNDIAASLACTNEALALRRQTGDALREGMNLRLLAMTSWWEVGSRKTCEPIMTQALAVLGSIEANVQLALAHSAMSKLRTAWSEFAKGLEHGEIALALAESLHHPEALVDALHVTAVARSFVQDQREACVQMERALEIAITNRMDDATGQLYIALQTSCLVNRQHAYALEVAQRGLAFCEARDLDVYVMRLLDRRALSLTELGRWNEADADLDRCLANSALSTRLRDTVMFLRKRQDMRRGDPSASAYWLDLQKHPKALQVEYRLPTVIAGCAEAAWFRGDVTQVQEMCRIGLVDSIARNDGRLTGPLLVWLTRVGAPLPAQWPQIAPAYAAEVSGDITKAAHEWALLNCPYERALALLGGNESQLREAFEVFKDLAAKPPLEIARQRLREMGAGSVLRGPQSRTKTDPLGLTQREREIFNGLLQGQSHADMAAQLHRSQRTVEHHVASLYAKLNVRSRLEFVSQYSGK